VCKNQSTFVRSQKERKEEEKMEVTQRPDKMDVVTDNKPTTSQQQQPQQQSNFKENVQRYRTIHHPPPPPSLLADSHLLQPSPPPSHFFFSSHLFGLGTRSYFVQLTKGCGNPHCNNPHCASGTFPLPSPSSPLLACISALACICHISFFISSRMNLGVGVGAADLWLYGVWWVVGWCSTQPWDR
jgi:hypothetical protein